MAGMLPMQQPQQSAIPQVFNQLAAAMPQAQATPAPVRPPMLIIPSGLTAEQVMSMKAASDASYAQQQAIAQRQTENQQQVQLQQQQMQMEKEKSDNYLRIQQQQAEAKNKAMLAQGQMKLMAENIKMRRPFAVGDHIVYYDPENPAANDGGYVFEQSKNLEGKILTDQEGLPYTIKDGRVIRPEGADALPKKSDVAADMAEERASATARHRASKSGGKGGGTGEYPKTETGYIAKEYGITLGQYKTALSKFEAGEFETLDEAVDYIKTKAAGTAASGAVGEGKSTNKVYSLDEAKAITSSGAQPTAEKLKGVTETGAYEKPKALPREVTVGGAFSDRERELAARVGVPAGKLDDTPERKIKLEPFEEKMADSLYSKKKEPPKNKTVVVDPGTGEAFLVPREALSAAIEAGYKRAE